MKKIYCSKSDVKHNLEAITKAQTRKNLFVNVSVLEYKGKVYPAGTMVIKIG